MRTFDDAFCRENYVSIEAKLTRFLHRMTKKNVDEQAHKKVHDIRTANYTVFQNNWTTKLMVVTLSNLN